MYKMDRKIDQLTEVVNGMQQTPSSGLQKTATTKHAAAQMPSATTTAAAAGINKRFANNAIPSSKQTHKSGNKDKHKGSHHHKDKTLLKTDSSSLHHKVTKTYSKSEDTAITVANTKKTTLPSTENMSKVSNDLSDSSVHDKTYTEEELWDLSTRPPCRPSRVDIRLTCMMCMHFYHREDHARASLSCATCSAQFGIPVGFCDYDQCWNNHVHKIFMNTRGYKVRQHINHIRGRNGQNRLTFAQYVIRDVRGASSEDEDEEELPIGGKPTRRTRAAKLKANEAIAMSMVKSTPIISSSAIVSAAPVSNPEAVNIAVVASNNSKGKTGVATTSNTAAGIANTVPERNVYYEEQYRRILSRKTPCQRYSTSLPTKEKCYLCKAYFRLGEECNKTSTTCSTCDAQFSTRIPICNSPDCWNDHYIKILERMKGQELRDQINLRRDRCGMESIDFLKLGLIDDEVLEPSVAIYGSNNDAIKVGSESKDFYDEIEGADDYDEDEGGSTSYRGGEAKFNKASSSSKKRGTTEDSLLSTGNRNKRQRQRSKKGNHRKDSQSSSLHPDIEVAEDHIQSILQRLGALVDPNICQDVTYAQLTSEAIPVMKCVVCQYIKNRASTHIMTTDRLCLTCSYQFHMNFYVCESLSCWNHHYDNVLDPLLGEKIRGSINTKREHYQLNRLRLEDFNRSSWLEEMDEIRSKSSHRSDFLQSDNDSNHSDVEDFDTPIEHHHPVQERDDDFIEASTSYPTASAASNSRAYLDRDTSVSGHERSTEGHDDSDGDSVQIVRHLPVISTASKQAHKRPRLDDMDDLDGDMISLEESKTTRDAGMSSDNTGASSQRVMDCIYVKEELSSEDEPQVMPISKKQTPLHWKGKDVDERSIHSDDGEEDKRRDRDELDSESDVAIDIKPNASVHRKTIAPIKPVVLPSITSLATSTGMDDELLSEQDDD